MPKTTNRPATSYVLRPLALACALGAALTALPCAAQRYPVTPAQQATAQQVASQGVPVSELSANAPAQYVVKRGDTLWGISGLFLQKAWRWPELWGMNLQDIRNPHQIYPGQTLYLVRENGLARLSTRPADNSEPPTVRISPRTRYETLADNALPTLQTHLIEPFLTEPLVVDEGTLLQAPRIVAAQDDRVLISRGDRAYARSENSMSLSTEPGQPRNFRIFRNAVALKDPDTGKPIAYEAQYVGRARLVRGEDVVTGPDRKTSEIIPATIDITSIKEEIRAGDRLLPEPPPALRSYVPHAPTYDLDNVRVISVYGSAVANAAQNQVIAINTGEYDGIEVGHVLAIMSAGARLVDKTDPNKATVRLPDERNGLAMVFRTFDRVSYALILEIKNSVRVGDKLINPN